jgi:hypothetical protein
VTRAQLGVAFATLGAVFAAASIIVAFGEGVTDFPGLAVLVLILIGIRGLLDRRRWAAWLLGAIALLDILGVWRLTAARELAAWMPRYVIHVGAIAGQGLAPRRSGTTGGDGHSPDVGGRRRRARGAGERAQSAVSVTP